MNTHRRPSESFLDFSIDSRWDFENGFYLTSTPDRLGKLFAHLDIYRMILNLPGHVVECGVFKGASIVRWATFRHLFETDHSRRIIGFDAFGSFPVSGDQDDQSFIARFSSEAGEGIPADDLRRSFQHKGMTNIDLVEGEIHTTIPKYLHNHPELKISLLHLDLDVYQPTRFALEQLFDRLVVGGVVVFDDYATVAGATRAIDEFLANKNQHQLRKVSFSHIPAFLVKVS